MRAKKSFRRLASAGLCGIMVLGLAGCGMDTTTFTGGKRIIRISHAQSETHPEHIGLLAFEEYYRREARRQIRRTDLPE